MPKELPPRNKAGRFTKKISSDQLASTPDLTHEPEATTSSSTPRDLPIESPSPIPAVVPRSPLTFPLPVRHSIPGAFSPLADSTESPESPIKSSIPFSTLVARESSRSSPSSVSFSSFRTPSPVSLPEFEVDLDSSTSYGPIVSDPDLALAFASSPSSDSSRTVSPTPRKTSSTFSVNSRASKFLSSRPDPPSTPSSSVPSSAPSSSAASSVQSQSLAPSRTQQALQTLPLSSTASASPTLVITPVAPSLPPVVPAPPPIVSTQPPAPPVHLPAASVPSATPTMAANPTGPSAMPYAKDNKAPYFSARPGDSLDDFLRDFEELATTCGLSVQQKLETILRYIPPDLRDLWKILDGYSTHDWAEFRRALARLYRSTSMQAKYSKQKVIRFRTLQQPVTKAQRRRRTSILLGIPHFLSTTHRGHANHHGRT